MGFEIVKEQGFKLFIKRLAIFLIFLVTADFLIGSTLRHFYFSQDSGLEAGTVYAINKANEDVIILGSSRASHHYVPAVLSGALKTTVYNAGREGNFILYHNAILQSIVMRHKPRIVILDILNKEFDASGDSYDRLSNLMPFYRSNAAIRPIVNLRGPFEPIKNMSFIYPYNSKVQTIAMGNLDFNKQRKQDFNGYVPLTRVMNRPPEVINAESDYVVDSVKVAAYKAILETCKNNNIRLFVVCSPYYDHLQSEDRSVGIAREIAGKYGINFWNFTTAAEFAGKQEIFDDKSHLNDTGARVYSQFVADKILAD